MKARLWVTGEDESKVQLAIPAKYVSGLFKMSEAAVDEDEEQMYSYSNKPLKAIKLHIWHRTINRY